MKAEELFKKLEAGLEWQGQEIPEEIPHGDMPGDKVEIGAVHIEKANTVFPELIKILLPILQGRETKKAVITVCGGSGVGKSEIASLLSYYFRQLGVGSYTLSGDNYPHRIPMYNDAERLRIYRKAGTKGLVQDQQYDQERAAIVRELQQKNDDANPAHAETHPWYGSYLKEGRAGLAGYLGTENEIDFKELEDIVSQFKEGQEKIWLKRMGRGEADLWYEQVDFSEIDILIIEWTHGNSDHYQGVDIPVLLHSTPEETLEHRRARNRDGGTDSPFTMTVLEIEQKMLESQAHKAKIILSKGGEILSYEQFCERNKKGTGV